MAKLYFKYGAMGSSKTANALMTRFNYEEKGKTVWLIKPAIDTRDDEENEAGERATIIKSRIGLSAPADVIKPDDNIRLIFAHKKIMSPINVIVCDECQFLTEKQVDQLKYIAETYDFPVLCFGLRSDFQTKLFEGSKRLMEIADTIEEIKSMCSCGNKAIVNARLDPMGNVITDGEQIEIGGNEKYEAMCYKCWKKKTNKE